MVKNTNFLFIQLLLTDKSVSLQQANLVIVSGGFSSKNINLMFMKK